MKDTFLSARGQACLSAPYQGRSGPGRPSGSCHESHRRVIFPSLYFLTSSSGGDLASKDNMAGVVVQSSATTKTKSADTTPTKENPKTPAIALDAYGWERARSNLGHLLPLSPLRNDSNIIQVTLGQDRCHERMVPFPTLVSLTPSSQFAPLPSAKDTPTMRWANSARNRKQETNANISEPVSVAIRRPPERASRPVPFLPVQSVGHGFGRGSVAPQNKHTKQEKPKQPSDKKRPILPNAMCRPPTSHPQANALLSQMPRSILRSKTFQPKQRRSSDSDECLEESKEEIEQFIDVPVAKVLSVDSDIPSLASTDTQSCCSSDGVTSTPPSPTRTGSKAISFDPRVWVREFDRSNFEKKSIWYTARDMEAFKLEALRRIVQCSRVEMIPTGTGRMISRPVIDSKALFSHPALRCDPDVEQLSPAKKSKTNPSCFQEVIEREIRSILLVDPHDICLRLFSKSLRQVMPHVSITAVSSSEEALKSMEQNPKGFDVIIIEERLKLFHRQRFRDHRASGAVLLRMLAQASSRSLFVGVSAHLSEDGCILRQSGADLCWAKPPPAMSDKLVGDMLKKVLLKRGRASVANQLFGTQ